MESQQNFGWIDLKQKNINIFYKDMLDLPPSGSQLQGEAFICVFKPLSEWMHTAALGMGSSALMRPIILLNT